MHRRSGDNFVVVLRLGRVTPIQLELQEEIVRLPTGPGEREAVSTVHEGLARQDGWGVRSIEAGIPR